jgi:hypothetical protein
MSSENLLLRLSSEDMKMLTELSEKQGLKKAEYLRMLLQTIYIAETTKVKEDKKGNITFNIGDYGYRLERKFIEDYAKELEKFFEGIGERMKRVKLSNPKPNKKVMMRQVVKKQEMA